MAYWWPLNQPVHFDSSAEECNGTWINGCYQILSTEDSRHAKNERLGMALYAGGPKAVAERGRVRFHSAQVERFVKEFIRQNSVAGRITLDVIAPNWAMMGYFGSQSGLGGLKPVGLHIEDQLTVWSHVQPHPGESQSQRLWSAAKRLDTPCWLLTVLAFLVLGAFFALCHRYHPLRRRRPRINWFHLLRAALSQDVCCDLSTIGPIDCQIAIAGWLLWMLLLASIISSLIVAAIVAQPYLVIHRQEDLSRAISDLGLRCGI